jgi:hypothetical protein
MAQAQQQAFSDLPPGAQVIHAPVAAAAQYSDIPTGAQVVHDPAGISPKPSVPAPDTTLTDMMGNGMPSEEDLNPSDAQHPVIAAAVNRALDFVKGTARLFGQPPTGKAENAAMLAGPAGPILTRMVRGQAQASKTAFQQAADQGSQVNYLTDDKGNMVTGMDGEPIPASTEDALQDARSKVTLLSAVNPFATGSVVNVNQLQDQGKPQQALGEGLFDAATLGSGMRGPQQVISDSLNDAAAGIKQGAQTVRRSGPGLMKAVDKGTDVLADALVDPRKMATETIPRAAGRAVKRMVGQPPTVATPAAISQPQLALPPAPIELPAIPAAPEPEGLFPAASTVIHDPITGESRVQFLTSRAEPEQGLTPQDTQLLNDPRGALARFAQTDNLGGMADALDSRNPDPFSNPIKPQSTLPAWAQEVTDWEANDPRHLFNVQDEHDFLNHQRQEEILQWIDDHNKQPEPFQSKGLKTSDQTKQPGLMRNAAPNGTSQPQVPTDENTLDLLTKSVEQVQAKKTGPGLMANDQPQSAKVGGAKVLKGDVPLTGAVSPTAADITRLTAELKTATDPREIADIQQALEHAQARMEGRPYHPPEQAEVENLPATQPRTHQPAPYTRGQEPAAAISQGSPSAPVPASSLQPGQAGIVSTSELNLDPKRFQFKMGTDDSGVTNQFKDTQKFNPDLAGVISTWTDPADGKTYVVNGHHRVELAQRTGEPTMLVRKLQASTAENARAQGALINIAEGRGTAVDAAKFFRDSGLTADDLGKEGVPISESKVSDGMALSKLDPSIFNKVATGQMPEQRGIAIGNATSDPVQQEAIVKLIEKQEAKGRKVNNDTVAELSRFVANSGNKTIEQGGLFGANQEIHSLALDKAEISSFIKQQIAKEKRVFGSVATPGKAEALGQVEGQSIQAGKNAEISQQASQALELFDKMSVTKGPVDDILESAAKGRASGYTSPEEAKRTAYEKVRAELQKTLGSGQDGSPAGSQTRPGFPAPPKR